LKTSNRNRKTVLFTVIFIAFVFCSFAKKEADFKVIAFYTAKSDQGHISFVNEANSWFLEMGKKNRFTYFSTNDWSNLSSGFISEFDVVILRR